MGAGRQNADVRRRAGPAGETWRGPSGLVPAATVPPTTIAATTTSILPPYLGAPVDVYEFDAFAVGTCLYQEPTRPGLAEEDRRVWTTDCTQPHHGELFHVVTLEGAPGTPFPGEAAVSAQGDSGCVAAFAPYVGTSFDCPASTTFIFTPLRCSGRKATGWSSASCTAAQLASY